MRQAARGRFAAVRAESSEQTCPATEELRVMMQFTSRARGSFRSGALALVALVGLLVALPAAAQNGPQPDVFELRSRDNAIRVSYRASSVASQRQVTVQGPGGIDLQLSGRDIVVTENPGST